MSLGMSMYLLSTLIIASLPGVLSVRRAETGRDGTEDAHRSEVIDIDSEMSRLLREADVLREDTLNKPGDMYRLHIDSEEYERNPWIHGVFKIGGAYGGLLAGAELGGITGMLRGGSMGMQAGAKAADTLTRILQGHGSVAMNGEDDNTGVALSRSAITSAVLAPELTQDRENQAGKASNKKEQEFSSSIREVLNLGAEHSADGDLQSASSAGTASGFMPSILTDALEYTNRKVLGGLSSMLKSRDRQEREDAMVTVTLLDIARHREEGVEVDVE
eukprot:TRINITY_DN65113_c0_g1_i1.p1 TRINITY_DN65113_c0_g1~~TRINITY_DN65113_c0_g1_i1.p1  ORF type:complete len:275 (-),score=58.84 TRINITY_DN65113_c0_g1_i1:71-895(-)